MVRIGLIGFGQQGKLYAAIQLSGWTGREVPLPCSNEEYNAYLQARIKGETEQ